MNTSVLSTTSSNQQSDLFGVLASSLCMMHCLATPFIFVVQAGTAVCSEIGPLWWRTLDYLFLVVSIIAIYQSAKTTSFRWIAKAMYAAWAILALLIINESFSGLPIPHVLIYIPAFSLVFLHLYNRKYARCETDECCVTEESLKKG